MVMVSLKTLPVGLARFPIIWRYAGSVRSARPQAFLWRQRNIWCKWTIVYTVYTIVRIIQHESATNPNLQWHPNNHQGVVSRVPLKLAFNQSCRPTPCSYYFVAAIFLYFHYFPKNCTLFKASVIFIIFVSANTVCACRYDSGRGSKAYVRLWSPFACISCFHGRNGTIKIWKAGVFK